jgi:hypothetical protein
LGDQAGDHRLRNAQQLERADFNHDPVRAMRQFEDESQFPFILAVPGNLISRNQTRIFFNAFADRRKILRFLSGVSSAGSLRDSSVTLAPCRAPFIPAALSRAAATAFLPSILPGSFFNRRRQFVFPPGGDLCEQAFPIKPILFCAFAHRFILKLREQRLSSFLQPGDQMVTTARVESATLRACGQQKRDVRVKFSDFKLR